MARGSPLCVRICRRQTLQAMFRGVVTRRGRVTMTLMHECSARMSLIAAPAILSLLDQRKHVA